ncbi:methyltransferase [Caenimonas sp. DR4.4]|uniref:Methyltransferase n=2 Tax=Caenimonas aquaedulcis TaxID=2793270 RepID=A0A931H591_9BURK|nr:methyltransferase [Caenimonas aquaedulcis]MBG9388665.1 methyltransferase [Caenimonas aquaedulcis]
MAGGYRFVTPTPLTHQRVLARDPARRATDLRGILGWSLPFEPDAVGADTLHAMREADVLRESGGLLRSTVRISTLGADGFLHSSYPTVADDSVFFGPDTYRFARFIEQAVDARARRSGPAPASPLRVLDIGCGSGAGAIVVARRLALHGIEADVTMNDINPRALRLAAANAAAAGIACAFAQGDALQAVEGDFDLIVSNPPYMADPQRRAYRDGGEGLGRALSVRIAAQALHRLAPGGQLLLYTGVAIVDGGDPFLHEVEPLLRAARCEWSYEEIDPDVFGEELEAAPYDRADRIAAVGLVATREKDR